MADGPLSRPLNGNVEIHAVTADRWDDLVALFGPSGAFYGCWCMFWRMTSAEFSRSTGAKNREGLHALVAGGREPGLLAYVDGRPAGWISLGPREDFPRLQRSRTLGPVDDTPVWSIVCFFIHRDYRAQGLAGHLLRAAIDYAAAHGATTVEGYPIAAWGKAVRPDSAYTGTADMFRDAGFHEVRVTGSRAGGQPRLIMRRAVGDRVEG